jgi:Coenzyme PQQ synthesis protein D (PqqD)
MSSDLPTKVSVPQDVLWQQIEDRVVLLDLASGEYHTLNDSGSRMWILLAETGDVGRALECLCTIYEPERAVLARDLSGFIGRLTESGLLEAEPS